MDALTLMVLASTQPRCAVIYTPPMSVVNVSPVVECAECAQRYLDDVRVGLPRLRQSALQCYSLLTELPRDPRCYQCTRFVELNLDITR